MIKRFKKYITSLVEQKVTEVIKKELGRKPEKKAEDFNLFADILNRVILDNASYTFDDGKSATGVFKTIEDLEKKIIDLEQIVKKGIEDGTKARKEMEKYLGITYIKRESKTEGYEKCEIVTPLYGSYTTTGSSCNPTLDVVKRKRTKKVAKKSKKK